VPKRKIFYLSEQRFRYHLVYFEKIWV